MKNGNTGGKIFLWFMPMFLAILTAVEGWQTVQLYSHGKDLSALESKLDLVLHSGTTVRTSR